MASGTMTALSKILCIMPYFYVNECLRLSITHVGMLMTIVAQTRWTYLHRGFFKHLVCLICQAHTPTVASMPFQASSTILKKRYSPPPIRRQKNGILYSIKRQKYGTRGEMPLLTKSAQAKALENAKQSMPPAYSRHFLRPAPRIGNRVLRRMRHLSPLHLNIVISCCRST